MGVESFTPAHGRQKLSDGTIIYTGGGGSGVLRRLAPGVLLLSVHDAFAAPPTEGPMRDFEAELEQAGKLTLFLDLSNRKTISAGSREGWAGWVRKNQGRLSSHVLVKSKLVDMAISVIVMMAGGLSVKSYTDVIEFEAAIAKEVPGFEHLPSPPANLGAKR
jgi:hypothetical protein